VRISLLGTSFSIQTDEDPEYVNQLVAYFESKINSVGAGASGSEPLKRAIIAGILIADELFREKQSPGSPSFSRQDENEMDNITDSILHLLDTSLEDIE
jgi:cell division protein ZapA (FtsZ GTPase activity inhibitor)